MKAREIMTQPVITVPLGTTLDELARLLLKHGIGGLPVVDADGKLCGMVTESDFSARDKAIPFSTLHLPQVFSQWMPQEGIERVYQAARSMKVEEIMTQNVISLSEEDSIERALTLMLQHDYHRLPVVKGGKPVGIISRHDLLKLMARECKP